MQGLRFVLLPDMCSLLHSISFYHHCITYNIFQWVQIVSSQAHKLGKKVKIKYTIWSIVCKASCRYVIMSFCVIQHWQRRTDKNKQRKHKLRTNDLKFFNFVSIPPHCLVPHMKFGLDPKQSAVVLSQQLLSSMLNDQTVQLALS